MFRLSIGAPPEPRHEALDDRLTGRRTGRFGFALELFNDGIPPFNEGEGARPGFGPVFLLSRLSLAGEALFVF